MGIIPQTMSTGRLLQTSDHDFDRLVVAPGLAFASDMTDIARSWRDNNQAFLAVHYPGTTIEQARARWASDADQERIQAEYHAWWDAL